MSNYQAIYDATFRALDPNNTFAIITQEFCITAMELRRPSVMLKPRLFLDQGKWCALLGENIQDGVCAFGETPDKAMLAFDEAYYGRDKKESQPDAG